MVVAPPFSGKQSLVNQVFMQLQKQEIPIKIGVVPLFNIRTWPDFLSLLVKQAIGSFVNTLDEWQSLCANLLPINHPLVYVNEGKINDIHLAFNPIRTEEQVKELLAFPEQLCIHFNERLIIHIIDFQNIELFDNRHTFLAMVLHHWKQCTKATYLATASKVNAIRMLNGPQELLKKTFDQITFTPIEERLFTDYIVSHFSKAGRVISKELAELLYETTGGDPYYTQYLAHLCFINTKGFMNEAMFRQAYEELLNILHRRFCAITDDLTPPQINFLKAIINGIERFCTAEVMEAYQLHSSANVTRVRTALEKKEILVFIRNKPHFLDPLFKTWFSERFISAL